MQVIVQSKFKDKHTGVIYGKGDKLDLDEKRMKEINESGHGELVKSVKDTIVEEK